MCILQSPPKGSIRFCRAECSKLRGVQMKSKGAPNPPLSWSKLDQASHMEHNEQTCSQPICQSPAGTKNVRKSLGFIYM